MSPHTRKALLERARSECGHETVLAMLEAATADGAAPGVCMECRSISDLIEPDAEDYECEECGEPLVSSVLVIAGVI